MSGRWGRPAMADLRRNISAKRRILAAPGIALALLGCGISSTIAVPPLPLLVWNASASAPMGLYRVGRPGGVGKGEMVIARLAEPYRSLAAKRQDRKSVVSGKSVSVRVDVVLRRHTKNTKANSLTHSI